ncbi:MAG: hypothetical protein JNM07_05505 [Phycisphaerae bacterium]|nr:hypothetical protein [Phycisphaerae bacterium]
MIRTITPATAMLSVLLAIGQFGPPPHADPDGLAELRGRIRSLDSRLEGLTPERPADYLLLGEEVASESETPEARLLARQLLVLAVELDRRQDGVAPPTHRVGPTACLALAGLSTREDERRWLRAMAAVLAEYANRPSRAPPPPRSVSDAAVSLDAATAIGLVRSGEGRRAQSRLAKPGVRDTIRRYEAMLSSSGQSGELDKLERRAREWPCPECGNKRFVSKSTPAGTRTVPCYTCAGNPGPRLTPQEFAAQLRAEAWLLNGVHRSWAAQTAADGGAPLRDLDPAELAEWMSVDPDRPLWRDGRWSSDEKAKPATAPAVSPGSPAPVRG